MMPIALFFITNFIYFYAFKYQIIFDAKDIIDNQFSNRLTTKDFVNLINERGYNAQALIKDKRVEKLFLLPASQTRDKDALSQEGVETVIEDLKADGFEYIVCDSPAGIEKGAFMALYFADEAIIVTNPEFSSVRDSDRILGILQSRSRKAEQGETVKEHLLVTRYSPERVEGGDMLSVDDIVEILSIPLLGVIPESGSVLQASNSGSPVILDQASTAGMAYSDAIERFLGADVPHRFMDIKKKGFFKKLFG